LIGVNFAGGVVVFLATEEARWITGDIIRGGAD
jgi:hypothetical protein